MSGDDARDELHYVVRGTHRSLAPLLDGARDPQRPGAADAGLVVVPVARSDPLLSTAAELALGLGWPLLLLCSHGTRARPVHQRIRRRWPGLEVTAADLLHGELLRAHREWTTAEHWAARQRLRVDTNRKRNLGLAAARMTGREWVVFVDDDIVRFTEEHVRAALDHVYAYPDLHVAGWPCNDFPDNSVVHHARRDFLRLRQDVFVSAGALLVRVDDWEPPGFPPIYNEDWLFLFEPLARRQVVAGPDIGQRAFDPYRDPVRAHHEEFGDVLGEGLFHLLHTGHPVEVARHAHYWTSVHAKRTKLLGRIEDKLRQTQDGVALAEEERGRRARALAAIHESREQLARATPESLADFVRRWLRDEDLWREFYAKLPQRDTLTAALVHLGLDETWVVTNEG